MNNIEVIGTTQVLKDAGVEPRQAEAIAKVVVAQRDDLATKSDIDSLRTEFKSDIGSLRNLLESKINNLRWTMVVVGGVVVTLVKFLP